jgi:hypothetical protein
VRPVWPNQPRVARRAAVDVERWGDALGPRPFVAEGGDGIALNACGRRGGDELVARGRVRLIRIPCQSHAPLAHPDLEPLGIDTHHELRAHVANRAEIRREHEGLRRAPVLRVEVHDAGAELGGAGACYLQTRLRAES